MFLFTKKLKNEKKIEKIKKLLKSDYSVTESVTVTL